MNLYDNDKKDHQHQHRHQEATVNQCNKTLLKFHFPALIPIAFTDTISVNIEIFNPFKNDLILKNSASSCGCTGLIITDSILKSNEQTFGTIKFIPSISGAKGNVEKAVVVETNSKQRFHEIMIKANVE